MKILPKLSLVFTVSFILSLHVFGQTLEETDLWINRTGSKFINKTITKLEETRNISLSVDGKTIHFREYILKPKVSIEKNYPIIANAIISIELKKINEKYCSILITLNKSTTFYWHIKNKGEKTVKSDFFLKEINIGNEMNYTNKEELERLIEALKQYAKLNGAKIVDHKDDTF